MFTCLDTNGDLTLDPLELEALFINEVSLPVTSCAENTANGFQLRKVYKDDMEGIEAGEDLARMREYAMQQVRT